MIDEALTDDELRAIVATSRDERARRTARRILNSRSDNPAMPAPLGVPVSPDLDEVDRLARPRVRQLLVDLGRPPSVAELGVVLRGVYRDLRPKG